MSAKKLFLLVILLLLSAGSTRVFGQTTNVHQVPDCLFNFNLIQSGGATQSFPSGSGYVNLPATAAPANSGGACTTWFLSYATTGVSTSITVEFQSAPAGANQTTAGTFIAYPGTVNGGFVNPTLTLAGGQSSFNNGSTATPFVRIQVRNFVDSGARVWGVVYGYKTGYSASGGGGGGSGTCVLSGGQTTGYVLTALDNSTACSWQTVGGSSVSADTIKNAWYIADTGTANVITGTTATGFPGSYAAGQTVIVKANATNTGATTININGLGLVNVVKRSSAGNVALVAANKIAGTDYILTFDGTSFQILNYTPVTADLPPQVNNTVLGNVSGITAPPTALTQTQLTALMNSFSSSLSGAAPASGGGTLNFLRADGTWNVASLFTSYQFGSQTAITGFNSFLQTVYPAIFSLAQTGTGTSGNPYVDTISLASESSNFGFFSPNGAPGTPTFRAMVLADLPTQATSTVLGNLSGITAVPSALTATQLTTLINQFTNALSGAVPGSGGGTTNFLRADGTWATPPGGAASLFTSYQFGSNTAITGSGVYLQTTYPNIFSLAQTGAGTSGNPFIDAISLASQSANLGFFSPNGGAGSPSFRAMALADIPSQSNNTVLGNISGGAASPSALSQTQLTALINAFSSSLLGAVPASGGGTSNFLRADGTWAAPGGGGGSGSAAALVTTTFSSTPTFTCPSNTAGTVVSFEMSTALSANISSSTLATCTNGSTLNFSFTQASAGGPFTVAMPTGFSQACQVSPIASVITNMSFFWDGTTAQLVSCHASGGPSVVPEIAAPAGTPTSGTEWTWPDSTGLFIRVKNSAGTFFQMAKELTAGNIRKAGGADTADSAAAAADIYGLWTGTGIMRTGTATASEISGDCTTSGSNAITCTKINGGSFTGVQGDLVSFGASNTPADAGFLATNVVRKDAINAGAAAFTLDASLSAINSIKLSGSYGSGMLRVTTATGQIGSAELSGDCTTSGSAVITCQKINGTSVPTNAAADQVLLTTAAATAAWGSVPNCGSATAALNYSTSTHAFGCQTLSGGGGGSGQTNFQVTAPSGFSGLGLSITSPTTVANTASATSLIGSVYAGRTIIPAGSILPYTNGPKTIHIHAFGTLSTDVTGPTVTWSVSLGGSTLTTWFTTVGGSLSSAGYALDFDITVTGLTTGTAGGQICGNFGTAGAFTCVYTSGQMTGLNFAADQAVDAKIQWGTASSSNTTTTNSLTVFPTQSI